MLAESLRGNGEGVTGDRIISRFTMIGQDPQGKTLG